MPQRYCPNVCVFKTSVSARELLPGPVAQPLTVSAPTASSNVMSPRAKKCHTVFIFIPPVDGVRVNPASGGERDASGQWPSQLSPSHRVGRRGGSSKHGRRSAPLSCKSRRGGVLFPVCVDTHLTASLDKHFCLYCRRGQHWSRMKIAEFKRQLAALGAQFVEGAKHTKVYLNDKQTTLHAMRARMWARDCAAQSCGS